MGEGGPIGGGIAAVCNAAGTEFETVNAHDLSDRDLIRISTATGPVECYAKAGQGNKFSTYNKALTQPVEVKGVVAGDMVERLNADDWAVIAGINNYPAFGNLKGPVNDATEFKKWTLRHGYLSADHVIFISSPPEPAGKVSDAKPQLAELSDAFLRLVTTADSDKLHRLGRRLYIFLSGHGIVPLRNSSQADYREAALLMANANRLVLTFHIGARAHAEYFRALGIFDEVILFADCCRDVEDNVAPAPLYLPVWKTLRPEGRGFYAFPTMLNSKAWEREFGNPATMRGIFSYVVVEALNNPKLYNSDGELPGSELEKHIYRTVPALNGKQDPYVDYLHNPNKPEIVFAKWFQRAQQRVQIDFDPACPGGIVELFRGVGVGKPLATSSTDQPWIDNWDAGFLYKVAIQGTNRAVLFEVTGNDEVQIVRV
jgi:hypothetical protein